MFSIQNYTTYSMLSGVKTPSEWAARAKALGFDALGVCDKQTLGGVIEFQIECEKQGIKPIFGEEFILVDDASNKADARGGGVVLLYAKNEQGFENLIRLNNFSHDREKGGGFYYRPRLDLIRLEEFKDGLICIVPTVAGYGLDVPEDLYNLHTLFRKDFFVGINPMLAAEAKAFEVSKKIAASKYQKVYTFDCHYPEDKDSHLYSVVRTLDNGRQPKTLNRDISNAFVPSARRLAQNIEEIHTYITPELAKECEDNLNEIKSRVDFKIPTGEFFIPKVQAKFGSTEADLVQSVAKGFKRKLAPALDISNVKTLEDLIQAIAKDEYPFEHTNKGEKPETLERLEVYADRLDEEFGIVRDLGFLEYFHIVHDICDFCDENDHARGFARGSAAGSLISYCLNITRVDPIRHKLLFERFLNPDRQDLPDIDLDFSSSARDAAKEYIKSKYGEERVVAIGTYSRLKVKSAVKTIAAAYSYGIPADSGEITKFDFRSLTDLLNVRGIAATARGEKELEAMLEASETFEKFYLKHKKWFDSVVMPLQESVVNMGVHAAGTLILPEDIDKCMPVYNNSRQDIRVTQWEGPHCEKRGFVKYDLLTVEGVDVLAYAKRLVERRGDTIPELEDLPLDDPMALDLFNKGNTEGIFQFKTHSQRAYLPVLKPRNFDHLVAAVSLIRPGPQEAGAHEEYADVVNGIKPASYDHEDLIPILKDTEGLLIYQESMMHIVQKIGGLTGPQADHARKAASKKKIEDLEKWESTFRGGGTERGYGDSLLSSLWEKIVFFSEYSFNKCLAKGTKVETPDGFKNIEDVELGDLANSENGFVEVLDKMSQGVKPVYRVVFESGRTLECTLDHKLETDHGMIPLRGVLQIGCEVFSQGNNLDLVSSASPVGEVETYDLEVDHPDHTFYANGISVSNSHATAYTLLSYYQAYIKARYPLEYWAAVMKYASRDKKHYNSIYKAKSRAEEEGVKFVFPTIYGFAEDFEPDKQGRIYWPLGAIKGLGDKAVAELAKNGRDSFTSMEDFITSVNGRTIHKGVVGTLIKAGFFAPIFDKPYEAAHEYYRLRREVLGKKDEVPFDLDHRNQFRWVKLQNEAYGMIVQSWKDLAPVHPKISTFRGESMKNHEGKTVLIAGLVESIRTRRTKNGGWYARMVLVDDGEEHAVMMWPEFWQDEKLDRTKTRPKEGQLIEIAGVIDVWNERAQLAVGTQGAYVKTIWDDGDF